MDGSGLGVGRDRLEADGTWVGSAEKEDIPPGEVITTRDPNCWASWFEKLVDAAFGRAAR